MYCIVDYYSKFPVVKKVASLSADDLVHTSKMTFAVFGLPRKIISDVVTNFTSESFRGFYRKLNIQQSKTSYYQHHSNGQVEACVKFVQHTIKQYTDTNKDINL